MCRTLFRLAAFVSVMVATSPCLANDTTAELSIGGLQFTKTADVSMESEELFVSLKRIRVQYKFTNTTSSPVKLTVAFPLPSIDLSGGEAVALPSNDPVNFVNFETKIDGNAIKFVVEQRAFVGKKDVSLLLQELKLPLLPIGVREIRVQDLPEASRTKMVSAGLLTEIGSNDRGNPLYEPSWVVKTSVVREQTFPVGRAVSVDHAYSPSVGTSLDTILRKALRQNKAMHDEVERYRREYCITDQFLAELDKLSTASNKPIQERRISYVLKTGANWSGPIKNFSLQVDKGDGASLTSFCAGGLKPSVADPLKLGAENFVPDRDLKILYVGRF